MKAESEPMYFVGLVWSTSGYDDGSGNGSVKDDGDEDTEIPEKKKLKTVSFCL